MANSSDRLVWIDCEMTGLDLEVDELVEIAVVITDFELNVLDPGLSIVIKPDASALENMNDFVRDMHTTSGLIEEIPNGKSLAEAEYEVLEYVLTFVPGARTAPLAACSSRSTCRASTTTSTTATSTSPRSRSSPDAGSPASTSTRPERTAD